MTSHPRAAVLLCEPLEDRTQPAAGASGLLAVGADAGGIPEVRVLDAATGEVRASFLAYDVSFRGGVRVAVGDLDRDGRLEVVTAPGPGGGPDVRVFDLATGRLQRAFNAYAPEFRGGANVDVGRLDGRDVIVTGAGLGGGPHVRVFDAATLRPVSEFFAYDASFLGGVTVAVGDVLGTGRGAVVTGAGPGGGSHVRVFTGTGRVERDFFAYEESFRGGVVVAAGDVAGLGRDAVVTGAGPGGGPHVRVFDALENRLVSSFFAYSDGFRGGVAVAVVEGGRGRPDTLVTGAGVGGGPHVNVYDRGFARGGFFDPFGFYAFPTFFTGGLAFGGGFGVFQPLVPLYAPVFGGVSFYDTFAYPAFLTPGVVVTETYFVDPVFLNPPVFVDPFFGGGFGGPVFVDPFFGGGFGGPVFGDPFFGGPFFGDPFFGGGFFF